VFVSVSHFYNSLMPVGKVGTIRWVGLCTYLKK
jgi:hypothetical protein